MLYKRPKSRYWWCRFTAPNGKEIRQSTKTDDKRLATEYEDRLKADLWRVSKLGDGQGEHGKMPLSAGSMKQQPRPRSQTISAIFGGPIRSLVADSWMRSPVT